MHWHSEGGVAPMVEKSRVPSRRVGHGMPTQPWYDDTPPQTMSFEHQPIVYGLNADPLTG